MIDSNMIGASAHFDSTGRFRYSLTREWGHGDKRILWIMLNPSTADAVRLDPTLRRCVAYSKAWGFDEMEVCNVYAFRTPSPDEMFRYWMRSGGKDIVGPGNRGAIESALIRSETVIVGWGGRAVETPAGAQMIDEIQFDAKRFGRKDLYCLGVNGDGSPKHPLYLSKALKPVKWKG